jgi:hypothetical protein
MAQVLVLVGTRKGLFLAESDEGRRDWKLRGPFCDGWPIYHAAYDPKAGTIYAAGASEWHGATIWRSGDLGETWEQASEGIAYEDGGRNLTKVTVITVEDDRILLGAEPAGIFESRDGGQTFQLITRLEGLPGRAEWDEPQNQPPGHLGLPAVFAHDGEYKAIIQGVGMFGSTDGMKTWAPRNKGLRRDWPGDHEEIGFCVHKVAPSPDPKRVYQQNHVGMHRSDDGGHTWTEITEGLPAEFGFAAAAHPHDRETFYVIPLDPGHARCMPEGKAAVWRTRDGGSSWQRLSSGLPQENAFVGVLREGMSIDGFDQPGLYFGTSTGQLYASADEGDSWTEVAGLLPGIASVDVAVVA